jgi:hypothetical protein
MEPQVSKVDDLDNFIDFLFKGLEGYVYVAAMPPNTPSQWKQLFLEYPAQVDEIKKTVRDTTKHGEVFIAPAVFKNRSADRSDFKACNVAWADFDGNAPEWDSLIKHPSIVIQSSEESRQHVYWRLQEPINDIEVLDNINHRIQLKYGADAGSRSAVHVLRPPGTINHKRQLEGKSHNVKLVYSDSISYDADVFNNLPPVTTQELPQFAIGEVPNFEDVVLRYAIPPDLQLLLKRDKEEQSLRPEGRSHGLMNAAYICCEAGMSDVEVFVVLKYLDIQWEKFSKRKDQDKQLVNIVTKARVKHPDVLPNPTAEEEDDYPTLIFPYMDFLNTELTIDWVIEGMLMDGGNMLLAGKSGIGKTQFSCQAMKHIALGKEFLGHPVPSPKKIGFLSLEMGHPDLQVFMKAQDKDLNDDERELLTRNLDIVPWGEAWPLNTPLWQEKLKLLIEEREWEGVFVDSIGSAILGNINSSETVQPFTNFNDHIRKKFGCFLWYIHHTRKAGPGQGGNVDQDDIYGDQYLVNRCTSAYGVLAGKGGTIKIRNFKNRLAAKEDDYHIVRKDSLNFMRLDYVVDVADSPDKMFGGNGDKPDTTAGGFTL